MRKKRASRRANPPLIIWANPGGQVVVTRHKKMSGRVYEVAYKHIEDGVDYTHAFGVGTEMYAVTLPDDSHAILMVGAKNKALWTD